MRRCRYRYRYRKTYGDLDAGKRYEKKDTDTGIDADLG